MYFQNSSMSYELKGISYSKYHLLNFQGGKSARVVNCVLALKSYGEWKQTGGNGVWKFGGTIKSTSLGTKSFIRKNSEPFMNSLSRTSSINEKSLNSHSDLDSNKMVGKLNWIYFV